MWTAAPGTARRRGVCFWSSRTDLPIKSVEPTGLGAINVRSCEPRAPEGLGAERHVERSHPDVEGRLRQAQGPARQYEKRGHAPDRRADCPGPGLRRPL